MTDSEEARSGDKGQRLIIKHRFWLLAVLHILLFAACYLAAAALRFDLAIPEEYRTRFLVTLPVIVGIKLVLFWLGGQFHGWWRIVSFRDLVGIAKMTLASLCVFAAADFFSNSVSIPRSILILDAIFTLIAVGGLRSTWRLFDEVLRPTWSPKSYQPAAMVGTDAETVFLAGQIQSHGRLPLRVVGLIAPDSIRTTSRTSLIAGFPVLGGMDRLESIVSGNRIQKILVHTELLNGSGMRKLMDDCKQLDVELQIVPKFEQRMDGTKRIPTRDINIEDLLRREPAKLDFENIRDLISGRTILITGAGGSIGSEICRQVIRFQPARMVLLGRGENRIFHIENELKSLSDTTILETVIADIRDQARIDEVFALHSPEVVFHAAAHKHVPLMEKNVREAVINNVVGTKTIVDAADKYECEKFVLISSDKSVRPTSVMGATKRVAEMYVSAVSQDSNTQFMSVRFGNVLGSAGSVVPVFKQQIERGGPITVTDERMTRFFMTIPEASQLVVQAASMGRGGDLFVLDMGEPVQIVDLARDLIRLSGLPPDAIDIEFTGMRPGEKLFEELADEERHILRTQHPKILEVERPERISAAKVQAFIEYVTSIQADDKDVRSALMSLATESQIMTGEQALTS